VGIISLTTKKGDTVFDQLYAFFVKLGTEAVGVLIFLLYIYTQRQRGHISGIFRMADSARWGLFLTDCGEASIVSEPLIREGILPMRDWAGGRT
jgi:hypothetical protein